MSLRPRIRCESTCSAPGTINNTGGDNLLRSNQCRYKSKTCTESRSRKANGELHTLCTYHRQKAVKYQQAFRSKKRSKKNPFMVSSQPFRNNLNHHTTNPTNANSSSELDYSSCFSPIKFNQPTKYFPYSRKVSSACSLPGDKVPMPPLSPIAAFDNDGQAILYNTIIDQNLEDSIHSALSTNAVTVDSLLEESDETQEPTTTTSHTVFI